MQIVLNGEYATRNGMKMRVTLIDLASKVFPVKAVDFTGATCTYTKTGSYNGDGTESPYDLVAEWQDEPAPVSPLVVLSLRGDVPGEDQAQGIRDFKDACRRASHVTMSDEAYFEGRAANPPAGPALLDWSATATADYAPLAAVLQEAYDQAASGKGKERHANDRAFVDQPILEIGRMCGPGFNTGQSIKKQQEAMGMLTRGQHEAAIRELLGAINYAASAIMLIRERNPGA